MQVERISVLSRTMCHQSFSSSFSAGGAALVWLFQTKSIPRALSGQVGVGREEGRGSGVVIWVPQLRVWEGINKQTNKQGVPFAGRSQDVKPELGKENLWCPFCNAATSIKSFCPVWSCFLWALPCKCSLRSCCPWWDWRESGSGCFYLVRIWLVNRKSPG